MKTNFSIECADQEDLAKTLLALVGLGYNAPYLQQTIECRDADLYFNYSYVGTGDEDECSVLRLQEDEPNENHFNTFAGFLKWFEGTGKIEKQIRELEETINQAKSQIEALKKEV